MQIKQKNDGCWDVANGEKKARIELGPRRITAKATTELLDNSVTADHYFAGERPVKGAAASLDGKKVAKEIGVDANGKPIKLGQDMTYIDWLNRKSNPVWYVYQFDGERYQPKGTAETQDEAISAAVTLVA